MLHVNTDTTPYGLRCFFVALDEEERKLLEDLQQFGEETTNWPEFRNYYINKVGTFYESRGLSRKEVIETPIWKIAEDICGRIQIAQGEALPSDYRDELELLVQTKFSSRREFCKATGLSEDMLSHVLAGRKNFRIDTLTDALAKIGYTLHIAPLDDSRVS